METILSIRQMLAESKFFEAQMAAELLLMTADPLLRQEVLPLYLESLIEQSKHPKATWVLEACELMVEKDQEVTSRWLSELSSKEISFHYRRVLALKVQMAHKKGKTDELYRLISDYQIFLYEKRIPAAPEFISRMISTYFKKDFHLKLQQLALNLMLKDLPSMEEMVKDLLLACVEKSSPKGTTEKLQAIHDVLSASEGMGFLEVYKNFCSLSLRGIEDKKDYKKLAEIVIFTDDFKIQALVLNLLDKLGLKEVAQDYALDVHQHADYDFVYFDKYFHHLKSYFFQKPLPMASNKEIMPPIDLNLEGTPKRNFSVDFIQPDIIEEESQFLHILKHQSYSAQDLNEIAVSFLQSQMPRVARKASEMAMDIATDDKEYLKGCYLKLTSVLQLGDYRDALDLSLRALNRAQTQDDILSFLYGQAEAYLKLKNFKEAKSVLKKITAIDAQYRFARERLEKLNEI